MPKRIEYKIGDTYRNLTIIDHAPRSHFGQRQVLVKCTCGAVNERLLAQVRTAKSTSCTQCAYDAPKLREKYGKLKVIGQRKGATNKPNIRVRCDCGNEKWVCYCNLNSGGTRSCGDCSGARKLKKTKSIYEANTPVLQPNTEANNMRTSGGCRVDGLCKYYRYCGDHEFTKPCRGYEPEKKIYSLTGIYTGTLNLNKTSFSHKTA